MRDGLKAISIAAWLTERRLPMKLLLLLLFVSSTSLWGQIKLPTNEIGQVQYQELVRLPDSNRPARQLIAQARLWIDSYYESENAVEQQYDQEHNILFIKSSYTIDEQIVRYTLTIEGKFGRYRATITDLIEESDGFSLPIRPTSPTADELSRVADGKSKNPQVISQAVTRQAALYRQLDKECRATLASLKASLLEAAPKKE